MPSAFGKKMQGEDVLEVLVRDGAHTAGALAPKLGLRDGRSVIGMLHKLEAAGLVRAGGVRGLWIATARGGQVDAILARITARRGGTFAPQVESGITINESLALR